MPKNRRPSMPDTFKQRLSALRATVLRKNLDGYFVTNREDQFYLTGFDGEDGAALILPRKVYLLTDGRFKQEAAEAPWATAIFRDGPMPGALVPLLKRHRVERLGYQPEAMHVATHTQLRRAIRPVRMVGVKNAVPDLRLRKDEDEIARIRKAVKVAEQAFKTVMKGIRPGMTERRIAADLRHEMVDLGATDASFPIIVAEGPNSAKPHAVPGDRKIKAGSAVLIDWGATVGHYRSDLTRVVFIRRIPPRFRRLYESVLRAQENAIGAIRPGARMCDVDAAARETLRQADLARYFTHGLGHGVGLDIHEAPRLSKRVTDCLEEGMVVTVEPGVYLPGTGGIRIEDDVLVTRDGCQVLSTLSKRIEDAII